MVRNLSVDSPRLVEWVEFLRQDATRRLDPRRRGQLGQFLTPPATARLMASMFESRASRIRLLDAGAGVGSLTAAWVEEMCRRDVHPMAISVTAYEIDPMLAEYLTETLDACRAECSRVGISFSAEMRQVDFLAAAADTVRQPLFLDPHLYDVAILNPPYKKIASDSPTRHVLRSAGIETSNLYTGFLALVMGLLAPDGELVAITPRSFANGPYFKPFRLAFRRSMTIRRVHIFDSRTETFQDDEVLQENIIVHAVKMPTESSPPIISASSGPEDEFITERLVDHADLMRPDDPDAVIHIVPDELGRRIAERMAQFTATLMNLGLTVSTGRVVDFRAEEYLRDAPQPGTAPLIYPTHLRDGAVDWPRLPSRKPNALAIVPKTLDLLVPAGFYVLVKRFSSKEERRRVVAAVYDPDRIPAERVAFENHLNYFHVNGRGLRQDVAKGLAAFLNSTLVDNYVRQFNGHTQVNAADLRRLRYPTLEQLATLGATIGDGFLSQDELDRRIEEEWIGMADVVDPVKAKKRITEAMDILKALGLPRQQQNERSALTLLAVLNVTPDTPWSEASAPLLGITPMMGFFAQHYGKTYRPNTRETVRRQTVHQFMAAALVAQNPDDPTRPTNSGLTVYQIDPDALAAIRTYDTVDWEHRMRDYLTAVPTLMRKYAQAREMHRIPVTLPSGVTITLSPGGQNVLVEKIVKEFCEYFTPGAEMIYVGDTDEKWAVFDEELLASLGVSIDAHGKMPDVVVYYPERNWLVLIEAVTSHGPVNPKRRDELERLFSSSTAGLVYVTTFLDRRTMARYLDDISWATEVWVADAPTHLIHFNGERFLGPY